MNRPYGFSLVPANPNGDPALPKERLECHWDGRSALLDDFRRLDISGAAKLETRTQEKGLREQWIAFFDAIRGGAPGALPWQQWQACEIALDVQQALES